MKIGIFDSGLGGLVITKALIQSLPEYDYLYLGDTAHLPYGEKTSGHILKYTLDSLRWLISQDCKLIIIACNTATSVALRYIQQKFIPEYAPDVKVLGVIIPTVEVALEHNHRSIGVIATEATIRSHIYRTELQKINPAVVVEEVSAPQLVPLIESNNFQYMDNIVEDYLFHFDNIDSLILGCTHYPLIKDYCRRVLPHVSIISQDELMGAKLSDYLRRHPEIDANLSQNRQRSFNVTRLMPQSSAIARRLIPQIDLRTVKLEDI